MRMCASFRRLLSRYSQVTTVTRCGDISHRKFSQAAGTMVCVDGTQKVEEVLAEAKRISGEYSRGIEILTVGQLGIAIAFTVVAALKFSSRVPAFTLAGEETLADLKASVRYDKDGNRYRERGRSFCLALPPVDEWIPQMVRDEDRTLLVGNKTRIQSLAKAITTRAGMAPEGQGIALETVMQGDEKLRRLRIAHMAQSVALAHHWQLAPRDARSLIRPFKCTAEISTHMADAAGGAMVLRLAVLPQGPPKCSAPA